MKPFPPRAKSCRPTGVLLLVLLLTLLPVVSAQNQNPRAAPRIGFVYPAGGRQDTKFTVVVSGQNLNGASAVYFTGTGVQGTVTGYERPLTQKEINDLREQLDRLQEKRAASRSAPVATTKAEPAPPWTEADEKLLADIKLKLLNRPNRQANPALAETVTLEVTLAPDVSLGERELRLKTPTGLSNPLVFCTGQLAEFTSPAVVVTSKPTPRADPAPNTAANRPATETPVILPTVINGQILPGEVDRYRFAARKGQRIVVAVSARALIPYLADAVPGWFQATLALSDAKGRELAYDDDFRFNPDPVLAYTIREDGDYTIAIKDSIYRGREDFVYRITVGELPFVTGIFPLGGPAEAITPVEVDGWNLPAPTMAMDARDRSAGDFLLSVRRDQLASNTVRFAVDELPECLETEPNDRPEQAQPVTLPVIVNGRIGRPDDQDVFSFTGRAGEQVVAEVHARRLNSPLDSMLRLTDAGGREFAANDDFDDKAAALLTHQADSRISVTLPADGTYYLKLGDTQHQGGPEFGYRLQIGPPRPDFALRVVPSSLNVRPGASVTVTVFALRHDGFTGEILLGLPGSSSDFVLSGARIPASADKVQLTLTALTRPRDEPFELTLAGRAVIDGKTVTHGATPAEDMMQAFAYRHLVPSQALLVAVTGNRGSNFRILSKLPVKLPPGGTARLQFALPQTKNRDTLHAELSDPPEGVVIQSLTMSGASAEILLASDPAKAKAGLQGNLIVQLFAEREAGAKTSKTAQPQRSPLGPLPAIPFEITRSP